MSTKTSSNAEEPPAVPRTTTKASTASKTAAITARATTTARTTLPPAPPPAPSALLAPTSPDLGYEDVQIISPPVSVPFDAKFINVQFSYSSRYSTANVRIVLQRSVQTAGGRSTRTYGVFIGHVKNGKLVEGNYANDALYHGIVISGEGIAKLKITPSMLELSEGHVLKVQIWVPGFDTKKSTSVAKNIPVIPQHITTTTVTTISTAAKPTTGREDPKTSPFIDFSNEELEILAYPRKLVTGASTVSLTIRCTTFYTPLVIRAVIQDASTSATHSVFKATLKGYENGPQYLTRSIGADDDELTRLDQMNTFDFQFEMAVNKDFVPGQNHYRIKVQTWPFGYSLDAAQKKSAVVKNIVAVQQPETTTPALTPSTIFLAAATATTAATTAKTTEKTTTVAETTSSVSLATTASLIASTPKLATTTEVPPKRSPTTTLISSTRATGERIDCSHVAKDPEVCAAEGMAEDLCNHSITGPTMRMLCPFLCGLCTTTSTTTSTSTSTSSSSSTSTTTSSTTTTSTSSTSTTSTSFPCHIYKCGLQCSGVCGWSKAVKTAGKEGTCIFGGLTVESEYKLGECDSVSTSAPPIEEVTPKVPLTNPPEELNAGSVLDGECLAADDLPAKVIEETEPLQCAALCTVTRCKGFATRILPFSSSGDCLLYFSHIVSAATSNSAAVVECHIVAGRAAPEPAETIPTTSVTTTAEGGPSTPRHVDGAKLQGNGDCQTVSGVAAKTSDAVDELDCVQLCTITACTGFATESSADVESLKCYLYFEPVVGVKANDDSALSCYTLAPAASSTPPTTSSAPLPLTTSGGVPSGVCTLLEPGYNYVGNDLSSSFASSPEACCDLCSKTAGCKYFTLAKKTCWMKYSNAGRKISRNGISGSVVSSGGSFNTGVSTTPGAPQRTSTATGDTTTHTGAPSNTLPLAPFGAGCCESDAKESEIVVWVTKNEEECLARCGSAKCHGVEMEYNYWKDVLKSVNCRIYSAHIVRGNWKANGRKCKKRKCWAKREATTTTIATQPSGEVAWQIEGSSSSTPDPTTTSAGVDCNAATAGFRVLAPQHLSDEYRWTGATHAGRPVFEAAGASEIYWYWMPPPLGVWSAGNAVGATSIYSYLLEDVESPARGTRPFVVWIGDKWVVEAAMDLALLC